MKFEVCVVSSRQEYGATTRKLLTPFEQRENINIFRCGKYYASKDKTFGRIYNYLAVFFTVAFTCLRKRLYLDKEIVVSVSNPPIMPLLGALLKSEKRKFVYIIHDLYPDIAIAMNVISKKHPFSRVMFFVNQFVFKRVDKVVVLGRDMKTHLMKTYHVPADRITIISNWANKDYCRHVTQMDASRRRFRLLYTGNLGRFHSLGIAIHAMRHLPEAEVVFVGEGAAKESLIEMSQNMENVKFYPFLMPKEYEAMLCSANVLFVSLEKSLCGLAVPSKFYTYLSAGKPILCVADKKSEISMEISNLQCGFVIEHDDEVEFIDSIKKLMMDRTMCERMGERAHAAYKEKYRLDRITLRYQQLFENL